MDTVAKLQAESGSVLMTLDRLLLDIAKMQDDVEPPPTAKELRCVGCRRCGHGCTRLPRVGLARLFLGLRRLLLRFAVVFSFPPQCFVQALLGWMPSAALSSPLLALCASSLARFASSFACRAADSVHADLALGAVGAAPWRSLVPIGSWRARL